MNWETLSEGVLMVSEKLKVRWPTFMSKLNATSWGGVTSSNKDIACKALLVGIATNSFPFMSSTVTLSAAMKVLLALVPKLSNRLM